MRRFRGRMKCREVSIFAPLRYSYTREKLQYTSSWGEKREWKETEREERGLKMLEKEGLKLKEKSCLKNEKEKENNCESWKEKVK